MSQEMKLDGPLKVDDTKDIKSSVPKSETSWSKVQDSKRSKPE